MKFSLSFIKEFFNPPISPGEVAQRLTMAGLEIENIEKSGTDYIFNAEVTPNRYDWLSMFGIANEIACLCKHKLKVKLPLIRGKFPLKEVSVVVENKGDCPVYIARLIRGVRIDESPSWLGKRVLNCGIKSINNSVDITNYCMLKWGNPLHVFDFDKIRGDIHIRRAKDKEAFVGLDDKEYELSPDNLVISDDKKVIALAGVIGAKNTEVDFTTKNILLEAAIFSPLTIRRSRRSVGLDTDSSYRFERNVSSKLLDIVSSEAARLLCELCGGKMSGYKKVGRNPSFLNKTITFSKVDLDNYIGTEFSRKDVKSNLSNLGFEVKTNAQNKICVKAPFFRKDIVRREDVFEEITRCYGYGRIKAKLPSLRPQAQKCGLYGFKKQMKYFLLRLGLNEVIAYSINSTDNLKSLKEDSFITLDNSLRSDADALRTTLLLGMIEVIRHNFNQKNTALRFFEIADIYKKKKGGFLESSFLSCAVTDEAGGFYYLKGVAEEALRFLNIEGVKFTRIKRRNFLNTLSMVYKDKMLGFIGQLDSNVRQLFDVKTEISFFEFDIQAASLLKKDRAYRVFSRLPVVYRDISLGLRKDAEFREIKEAIGKTAAKLLCDYRIIDIYKGKDIHKDFCVFTLRVFYNSQHKTLTAEEVDGFHFKLREELSKRKGIILR